MRVLLLTRYGRLGASSRLRFFQYLPYLQSVGIEVAPSVFFDDDYILALMTEGRRPMASIAAAYARRIRRLVRAIDYDLVWIEYEALPWLPFGLERVFLGGKVPYVVEYDDAVFHRYDLHRSGWVRRALAAKIPSLMRGSSLVIAGNDYIAGHARQAGAGKVAIIPTAVDLGRYEPVTKLDDDFVVGWIGSPVTARYLDMIAPALRRLAESGAVTFRVIGAEAPRWQGVKTLAVSWSEESEAREIGRFDVGVMPLPDEPWERGKCGYKLIQYMAAAKPVVASPVGANSTIVEAGVEGFLAEGLDGWVDALLRLRNDKDLRSVMGQAGRDKVRQRYCTSVVGPRLAEALRSAAEA